MNNFHLYNIETFKKYQLLKEHTVNNWSYPLLVSPNSLNEKGKILYIGQETNTWGRNMKFSNPIIELENMYDLFITYIEKDSVRYQQITELKELL